MNALAVAFLLFFAQAAPPNAAPPYSVVFLRPDPASKPISKEDTDRIKAAHLANVQSMARRGVLVAVGLFDDKTPSILGIFVLKISSLEEAKRIAAEDPTVAEHRTVAEVHSWRGPAGIGDEYRRLHKENPATPENMGVHPLVLMYRGDAWSQHQEVLSAHRDYMERLLREGKLAAAGPSDGDRDLVGIGVFQRIPDEEAERLMADDPSVKAGVMRPEFHRWLCAAHVLPQ
jgi:uncharacterized protein YciI